MEAVRKIQDREPVSSLADALRWLITYDQPEQWMAANVELPPVAKLVCDMFWITDDELRAELRKLYQGFGVDTPNKNPKWWKGGR